MKKNTANQKIQKLNLFHSNPSSCLQRHFTPQGIIKTPYLEMTQRGVTDARLSASPAQSNCVWFALESIYEKKGPNLTI